MKRLVSLILCSVIMLALEGALAATHFTPNPLLNESASRWFVGMGGGLDWVSIGNKTNTLVTSAGNPPDTFALTGSIPSNGLQEIYAGYRWKISGSRYVSVQLTYQHLNSINVSELRTTLVFGIPFTSVDTYKLTRQSLLLLGQLNLCKWHSLMPFVQAGMNFAKNNFSNFNDTNTFTMPAFPNKSNYDFGAIVGAGLDWEMTRRVLVSLSYRYDQWGDIKSGDINTDTSGNPLPRVHLLHTLDSQQVIATLTYLFSRNRGY